MSNQETSDQNCRNKGRKIAAVLAIILIVAACGAGWLRMKLADPSVVLLIPEGGASWIRPAQPVFLGIRDLADTTVYYRTNVNVNEPAKPAVLTVRALRAVSVSLDGQYILTAGNDQNAWKNAYRIDLTNKVARGTHELCATVVNRSGPACLLAYCRELDLATGSSWEASSDGVNWAPAGCVDVSMQPEYSKQFPPAYRALLRQLPFLASVFGIVFVAAALGWRLKRSSSRWTVLVPSASMIRWFLIAAWLMLAANNLTKVPLYLGYDARGHMEYAGYVAEHHWLPLPTEGWTTFQPPLYYILAGIVYAIVLKLGTLNAVGLAVRCISLLCGIAQVEVCYRAMRRLWPQRDDLQAVGTVVGSLLPINLYMSQYAGNEPLTALLVSIAFLLSLRFLCEGEGVSLTRAAIGLGLVLGAALLGKTTAVFMIGAVMLFLATASFERGGGAARIFTRTAKLLSIMAALIAVVAGWYYLRNWIELGRPFYGGWEQSRGIGWWQDPGYRTLGQFARFGEALVYPIFAGMVSFWDAIYATLWGDVYCGGMTTAKGMPPWHFGLLLSGAWLGLIPTALLLIGGVAILRHPLAASHRGLVFALVCLGVYFGALLYGFLSVPYFCIAKASYTLGLLPCYGAVAAAGVAVLPKNALVRTTLYAALATWGMAAYLTYFAL